jgi:hypothetical protein
LVSRGPARVGRVAARVRACARTVVQKVVVKIDRKGGVMKVRKLAKRYFKKYEAAEKEVREHLTKRFPDCKAEIGNIINNETATLSFMWSDDFELMLENFKDKCLDEAKILEIIRARACKMACEKIKAQVSGHN